MQKSIYVSIIYIDIVIFKRLSRANIFKYLNIGDVISSRCVRVEQCEIVAGFYTQNVNKELSKMPKPYLDDLG